MENLLDTIRNAVRAVIIKNDQLLVLQKTDGSYSLPGGAPDAGESLEEGLQRECVEEIGSKVQVNRLAHVGDYFKLRKSDPPNIRHHIEFLFDCSISDDYVPHSGHHPDKRQIDVVWLDLASLEQQPLFPASLKKCIQGLSQASSVNEHAPVYIGVMK